MPNYNVLIITTDSGLFGKSGIKNYLIWVKIISFSPGARVTPPPGVDGGPVSDVENDEQHGKHTEKYQVCPGKSENSILG